jgi:hypothetical protein
MIPALRPHFPSAQTGLNQREFQWAQREQHILPVFHLEEMTQRQLYDASTSTPQPTGDPAMTLVDDLASPPLSEDDPAQTNMMLRPRLLSSLLLQTAQR